MKIVIADENPEICKNLAHLLQQEGFEPLIVHKGQELLALNLRNIADFICLNTTLLDMSGLDACRQIRQQNAHIPIIFISNKTDVIDRVLGLELGADDYICTPYNKRELIARIRTIARRSQMHLPPNTAEAFFTMAHITVFPNKLEATTDTGQTIPLSLRETKILQLLYNKRNMVVLRDDITDHCWGVHVAHESRTIDYHICKLRKRIEKDSQNPHIIKTVHGAGYRFNE